MAKSKRFWNELQLASFYLKKWLSTKNFLVENSKQLFKRDVRFVRFGGDKGDDTLRGLLLLLLLLLLVQREIHKDAETEGKVHA